jgi:hypothetical protein
MHVNMQMTLLGIPVHDIAVAFTMMDSDDSGYLDQTEFKAVMASLRKANKASDRATGIRPGAKGHSAVEEGGLLTYFFGSNGKGHLTLKKFEEFLNKLHDEIVLLEFTHYDFKVCVLLGVRENRERRQRSAHHRV